MFRMIRVLLSAAALLLTAGGVALAQDGGTLERIRVFGPSLEGNLEGDDPNRDVIVYLPPSYNESRTRRYPVLYYLHGYTAHAEDYINSLAMPGSADQAIGDGAEEMIIVFPDAYTVYSGSMFSNSPTTGDWEAFVAEDLVSYIDDNYRTISERASRGLTGHSMGGYGTLRVGMRFPKVFGAVYAASSCCLMNQPPAATGAGRGAAPGSGRAVQGAGRGAPPGAGRGRGTGRGALGDFSSVTSAQAAAWAPNPSNAPDYFDLPAEAGERQAIVAARWAANSPLVMVGQHVPALRSYAGALMLDVGDRDTLGATNTQLHDELLALGIEHTFEVYEGDHMNQIPQRFIDKVLPYFSEHLR